jgi:hypothetical protein
VAAGAGALDLLDAGKVRRRADRGRVSELQRPVGRRRGLHEVGRAATAEQPWWPRITQLVPSRSGSAAASASSWVPEGSHGMRALRRT